MTTRVQRSFCRICIAQCGVEVVVDGNAVLEVRGDRSHPLSQGYTCTKGRALPTAHHGNHRLDHPLLGRDDERRRVGWDECLGDLGSIVDDVLASSGSGAVGFFTGGGAYPDSAGHWALRRFQTRLGTGHLYSDYTIDSAPKFRVVELMLGTYAFLPQPDDEARLLLLVGTNPVVSHGHTVAWPNPVQRLRAFRAHGEVWLLDPRATETARLADRHLAVRPGADHAVLAFLVRGVLAQRDLGELAGRADGVDALAAAVAPYDRDHAAAVAGVPPGALDDLLAAVLRVGRVAVMTGTGSTMSPGGNATEWLAMSLLVVTDSLDRSGGVWMNPGYVNRLDARDVLPATGPPEPGAPSRPDITRLMGEWPAALIPDEIDAGRLRVLFCIGANLVTALPDATRVARTLRQLDALVVLDVAANETTELATHVLPCTSQLERADVTGVGDLAMPEVFAQYTEAVVAPSAERRPMWRVVADVAGSAGIQILPGGADPATVDDAHILAAVIKGRDLAELRNADGGVLADRPAYGWTDRRVPRGRVDLAPPALVENLATLSAPAALVLTPRRSTRRMNQNVFRAGERAEVHLHPDDAVACGVVDGDEVEVRSTSGTLQLPVRVTASTRVGAASIPHGWADANVNLLVSGRDLDPLTGMPLLSGTPVTIAKAGQPSVRARRRPSTVT